MGNIRHFIKTLQAKQHASVRGRVVDKSLFADKNVCTILIEIGGEPFSGLGGG